MARHAYRRAGLQWPITPEQLSGLDQTIDDLYQRLRGQQDATVGEELSGVNDTNVTITIAGSPATALLHATSITLGWTGVLAPARGGTGTATVFTQGSVVFAGALGVYAQDNGNLFWNDTDNRLGIGTASPVASLANTNAALSDGTHASAATSIVWNITAVDSYVAAFKNSTASFGDGILIIGGGDKNSSRRMINVLSNDGTQVFRVRGDSAIEIGVSGAGSFLTTSTLRLAGSSDIAHSGGIGLVFSPFNAASAVTIQQTTGNVAIGTTTLPATGTAGLVFGDGTALASMGSNTAGIYANDVSGTVRMFAIDEAGVTGAIAMQAASLTAGSVVFAGATGLLTQDNAKLFWNDSDNRLGVGTASPSTTLHVLSTDSVGTLLACAANGTPVKITDNTNGTMRVSIPASSTYRFAFNDGTLSFGTQTTDNSAFTSIAAVVSNAGQNRLEVTAVVGGTALVLSDSVNASLRVSFPSSNVASIASNETDHSIAFGGQSATGGPFTERFRVDNTSKNACYFTNSVNVGIGTTTFPTAGTYSLIFGDGTVPSGMPSNTAGLYANDVGGTVHMFAIDESGAVTQLSGRTSAYTPTNVTTDRAYDANATTIDELADVLGTLIADLQARGICG